MTNKHIKMPNVIHHKRNAKENTMRHHFTLTRMARIFFKRKVRVGKDTEILEPLYIADGM